MNVTFMIRFQRLTYRQAVSPLPSHLHAVMEQAARLRLERLNIARNYTWSLANNQRGTKALSPTACKVLNLANNHVSAFGNGSSP